MENLRRSAETKRLIYADCVINEREPESWSRASETISPPADKALALTLRRAAKFTLSVPRGIKHQQKHTAAAGRLRLVDFTTALMVLLES